MAVTDEIKEQQRKLKDMTFGEKAKYIWDYYKVHIIVSIVIIFAGFILIRDLRENQKPTYLYAVFLNSNFAADATNTLEDDYIRCRNVDTENEHVYFSYDINFSDGYFDTVSLAYQQKLVGLYETGDLDIVIGPVKVMETSADCNGYGDFSKLLPEELIEDLKERGYEFYTYKGHRYTEDDMQYLDEEDIKAIEEFEPYIAGIYLDNCSYLNNMGEYGAYSPAESEDDRPILTIPYNTQRLDKAIDFIKFITE